MRVRRGSIILASFLAQAAFTGGAAAWQTNLDLARDTARAVAFDASGNVVVVGEFDYSSLRGIFTVAKLSGTDGVPLWQTTVAGAGGFTGQGTALAIDPISFMDPIGFITVAGSVDNATEDFIVAKLVPFDGFELWRHEIDGPGGGSDDRALAMALDSIDVVAGGYTGPNLLLVKLDGSSGAELWRWPPLPTQGQVEAVAVDSAASIAVAVGSVRNSLLDTDLLVVAVDLTSGAELWQRHIAGTDLREDTAHSVAVDPSDGSIAVAGVVRDSVSDDDFFVVKFDAAGTELWRHAESGTYGRDDVAYSVAVDPSGDVIAAGALDNVTTHDDLALFKYAGTGGALLWQRQVDGTRHGDDRADAVTVETGGGVIVAGLVRNHPQNDFEVIKWASDGTPVWRREINGDDSSNDEAVALALQGTQLAAAGFSRNVGTREDATVVTLNSADGSGADARVISGKRLTIRDKESDPTKRKVYFVSNADLDFAPGDPADPTIAGATLEVLNPGTLEIDTYLLPPTQWRFRNGGPFGPDRYVYSDPDLANGPCKRVAVKRGHNLRAICTGSQIGFSLNEAAQGAIEVRLHLGTDPYPYCMVFGGTILRDNATAGSRRGYFKAVDAHAVRCPVP